MTAVPAPALVVESEDPAAHPTPVAARPRRSWKPLIKIGISLALVAAVFLFVPWRSVWDGMRRMSPEVWLAVFGLFVVGHLAGVLKWRMLVNAGRANLGFRDAVRCYAAGLYANTCLPSIVGGDVLRAALAGRVTGRPEAAALAGLADRLLDFATMGVLILAGGLFGRHALPNWGRNLVNIFAIAFTIGALYLLPLALKRPLARWPKKVRRPIARTLVALRRMSRNPGAAVGAFALSLVIQSSFVLLNAWIGREVGVSAQQVPLAAWFLVWPLAKVAALVPISFGGLAVRDSVFASLLLPMGVPFAVGWVAALVWQSILYAGGLLCGLVWWLLGRQQSLVAAAQLSPEELRSAV